VAYDSNVIGRAAGRGLPRVPQADAEELLSDLAGHPLRLPEGFVMSGGPKTCPACGSTRVIWGCDPEQTRPRDEIHPVVWDEEALMADSFLCRDCDAGWVEPVSAEPITWVRPYWRVSPETPG